MAANECRVDVGALSFSCMLNISMEHVKPESTDRLMNIQKATLSFYMFLSQS